MASNSFSNYLEAACRQVVCLGFLLLGLPSLGAAELKDTHVRLAGGGTVTGLVDSAYPSVRQFLGIPYAEAPVDSLRWKPPQPLRSRGNVTARSIPQSCMQSPVATGSLLFTYDAPEFLVNGVNYTAPVVGEDCLTLSLWAPELDMEPIPTRKLPVIVFLPGGRFQTGGQAVPYQIPTQWVQRSKELIVITINYRVNIWGYPNAAGIETQNLSLLDQRAAVEWVTRNIESFGGDPTRVTLWGQSAGAMSVDFYNYAFATNSLVTGLIMDSGSAISVAQAMDSNHSSFTYVASQVGCGKMDAKAELECMQKVPASTIQSTVGKLARSGVTFSPMVDNKLIFSDYRERALAGNLSSVPAIMGTNVNEGAFTAPDTAAGPGPAAIQRVTLSFLCPSVITATSRMSSGRNTFRYVYSGNFTNISPKPWEGAYHCSELPLLFGTHPNYRGNSTAYEYDLSAVMQDTWLAFARDPQHFETSRYGWPAYRADARAVRAFGPHGNLWEIQTGYGEDLCASYSASK